MIDSKEIDVSPEEFQAGKKEALKYLRSFDDNDKTLFTFGKAVYLPRNMAIEVENETEDGVEFVKMLLDDKDERENIVTLGDRIKFFLRKPWVMELAVVSFVLTTLMSSRNGFKPSLVCILIAVPFFLYLGASILVGTGVIGSSKK